jgi:hypothetical protein
MKKPDISNRISDPNLMGSGEQFSWVQGRNGVYRDGSVAQYRVSVNTDSGWKTYGHFNDIETATYIANIAILVEGCEGRYELNSHIGDKDKEELARWRSQPKNSELERFAAEKYKVVKAQLDAVQKEEQLLADKILEEQRLLGEMRKSIPTLSNPDLVNLIKNTKAEDPLHALAMKEAVRRFKKLGLPRET